jgi:hypothetical protein
VTAGLQTGEGPWSGTMVTRDQNRQSERAEHGWGWPIGSKAWPIARAPTRPSRQFDFPATVQGGAKRDDAISVAHQADLRQHRRWVSAAVMSDDGYPMPLAWSSDGLGLGQTSGVTGDPHRRGVDSRSLIAVAARRAPPQEIGFEAVKNLANPRPAGHRPIRGALRLERRGGPGGDDHGLYPVTGTQV